MPDKSTYHRFLGFGMAFIFIFAVVFFVSKIAEKFSPTAGLSGSQQAKVQEYDTAKVQVAGQTLSVELARTSAQQELGLSGRSGLADGTGMLFVFEKPAQYGFWMKDMNFPLDIIWLSDAGKAIFIKKNLSAATYPTVYTPPSPAKYVLEVPAGFSEKNKLKLGETMKFLNAI